MRIHPLPFSRTAATALLAISFFAIHGCAARNSNRKGTTPTARTPAASGTNASISDPCAGRLQDIGGTLLLYFAIHKELPAKLEDLRPLADVDQDLQLSCPLSKQPYLYIPTGLGQAGHPKRIVVCDPTPSHQGQRWCLLMDPPRPGKAVSLEVLELPETVFQTYHRAGVGVLDNEP